MYYKKNKSTQNKKPTRKQLRKAKRVEKKAKKNEYFSRKKKTLAVPGQFVHTPNSKVGQNNSELNIKAKTKISPSVNAKKQQRPVSLEQERNLENEKLKKLQKEMAQQRNKQLKLANEVEDRNIKKLEKQLKLNKRKSKGIPKSFAEDGLGYLLEICDSNNIKSAVSTEQHFADFDKDFIEDLELMGDNPSPKKEKKSKPFDAGEKMLNESEDDFDSEEAETSEDEDKVVSDDELSELDDDELSELDDDELSELDDDELSELDDDELSELDDDESVNDSKGQNKKRGINETELVNVSKRKKIELPEKVKNGKQIKKEVELASGSERGSEDEHSSDFESSGNETDNEDGAAPIKGLTKVNPDGTWEDIYGRLRGSDGSLITNSTQKYIPPAVRAKMEKDCPEDKKILERLNRLKKQLKGLINRLAERNMHNIATQIEKLYMENSRNDMNETLSHLIMESIASAVLTPERLLMEHVMLIAVLHANVGTEVGAHFLQTFITKFDETLKSVPSVEDKTLDNIVIVLAQLYNFKLFDAKLMYEILHKLAENFVEKNIDCILHVLKSVGFNLRKDNPLSLKDLILELQKKAALISSNAVNGSRVKFLLDVLLAIKNNNMSKIPNYDNSYSEHLKKIMKAVIRKGNYVSPLNITLEDLLKAHEKGKWWVVGSAWTGNISENREKPKEVKSQSFSQKLLDLAKKQRMNTDTRRNIFCIIMSAENYLDAFEKLLRLGLTNNQDREIIHVILHCCLKENPFNPYYAVLAQKFCEYDRKYMLTMKYSIWDKIKALDDESSYKLSNLAKLLIHLFLEKGLPISALKVIQFSELDKITLRFIRQILLGILLHKDVEACIKVFENVAQSDKLKMFRDSLRLFIHHFLLRNCNSEDVDEKQKALLETRAKTVEKLLVVKDWSRFES